LPQMVQKFYSIKSESYIKSTMIVCTIFSILMAFGAYYTGALTHLYAAKDNALMDIVMSKNFDNLMPTFIANHTSHTIAMIIVLLVFSASMSSLSSLVLVSSSAIAMDLYSGIIKPNASKNSIMLLMRIMCGIFVLASLYIALKKPLFIVDLMVIAWGALAGSFAAPFVYGLFWRRTTTAGAISGMLSGLIIVLGMFIIKGPDWIAPAGAMAIIVPFIVVPVVSLLTKPVPKEIVSKAFAESGEQNNYS